jgi:hypothetical protein
MTDQFVDRQKLGDIFHRVAAHVYRQEQTRHVTPNEHNYSIDAMTDNTSLWKDGDFQILGIVKYPHSGSVEEHMKAHTFIDLSYDENDNLEALKVTRDREETVPLTLYEYSAEGNAELTTEKAAELCTEFAKALSDISSFSMQDIMDLLSGEKPTFDQQAAKIATQFAM